MEKDFLSKLGLDELKVKKLLEVKDYKPKILSTHTKDHKEVVFAIVSDTHLCSTKQAIDELHTFYAVCKKDNIKHVFHCGDLVAGWGIYNGQENEVSVFGADNQAQYAVKNYPRVRGIKTYFITGNHDLSFWKRAGIDIGEIIMSERKDMIYLGQYQGDVILDGLKIRLVHPDGGGAYALSYRAQKIAEQIQSGEDKPRVLIFGHWHTSHYFFYRNMHIINAGCFEKQTTFLLRKGISPTIGGWIVAARITDEKPPSAIRFVPTFIPFFIK